MDERVIQFRVGVVMIAAALITGILIVLFGEGVRSQYTVYMKFPTAPGVAPGAPIRKNGILIGRVSKVELVDDGVLLTADIDTDRKLRQGERPQIGTASLLGDAVVNFVPGPDGVRGDIVEQNHLYENGVVEPSPLEAIDVFVEMEDEIKSAIASVDSAGRNFSDLSKSIQTVVGDNEQDIRNFFSKSQRALDEFSVAMNAINDVVGDDEFKEKLKKSLEDLPQLFADAQGTLQEAREMLDRFEKVGQRAEANFRNLEGFTEPLGKRGPDLVEALDRTMTNADKLLQELATFGQTLNEGEGSLGRLTRDPELYERVNRAAANIEELSTKLVPIMNNLRVFSDKIARDPRLLGVKGALSRQPSGMGLKPNVFRE